MTLVGLINQLTYAKADAEALALKADKILTYAADENPAPAQQVLNDLTAVKKNADQTCESLKSAIDNLSK